MSQFSRESVCILHCQFRVLRLIKVGLSLESTCSWFTVTAGGCMCSTKKCASLIPDTAVCPCTRSHFIEWSGHQASGVNAQSTAMSSLRLHCNGLWTKQAPLDIGIPIEKDAMSALTDAGTRNEKWCCDCMCQRLLSNIYTHLRCIGSRPVTKIQTKLACIISD